MKQVILSSTSASPSTTIVNYINPFASQAHSWASSLGASNVFFLKNACRITKLTVDLETAPGAGKSWVFRLHKNNTTDLNNSVTIADTATQGFDITSVDKLAAGDYIQLKCTPSGTPTTSAVYRWSFEIETFNNQFFTVGGSNSLLPSGSVRSYFHPLSAHSLNASTTESNSVRAYLSGDYILNYIRYYGGTPGAGNTWTYSVYKNGAEEASSIGAVTGGSSIVVVSGLNISFQAGDYFTISIIPSGTLPLAAPSHVSASMAFTSVNSGETFVSASPISLSTSATTWFRTYWPGVAGSTTSETNSKLIIPKNSTIYMKNFRAVVSVAPGTGKSWTFSVRKNAAAANNSIQITGAGTTTGSDLTNIDRYNSLDYISSQVVPASTPAAANGVLYATMYIPPENPMMGCNF